VATLTNAVTTTPDTSNTATYVSAAHTPVAGDLMFYLFIATATATATPALLASAGEGGTYALLTTALKNASVDRIYAFIANQFSTAVSRTMQIDLGADPATSCIIFSIRVAGLSRTGVSAVRQFKVISNQAGGAAPNISFDAACLTGNPTLGVIANATNPCGVAPPTNWSEILDTGNANPTTGGEYVTRNSGFTGTQMLWTANSATNFGGIIVEFDASAKSRMPYRDTRPQFFPRKRAN